MSSRPTPTVEQFWSPYDILTFSVSADESTVVMSCNLDGTYNLWSFHVEEPVPQKLTSLNQRSDMVYIHTEAETNRSTVFFTADHDGDEAYQLYSTSLQGGNVSTVRSEEGKRFFFAGMSEDGKRIYYSSNKDRPMYLNLYRYHLDSGEEEILMEGKGAANYLVGVSPDETTFAYTKQFGRANWPLQLYRAGEVIYPVADESVKHVTHEGHFVDSDTLYVLTNYQTEDSYLASYHIPTKSLTPLLSIDGKELRSMGYCPSTGHIFVIASQGVQDSLYRFHPESKDLAEIELPTDCVQQLVVTEAGSLYILATGSRTPLNIYQYQADSGWRRLTQNDVDGVDFESLIEPEVLHYPSFDGLTIEALYYPANPARANGHTIVWPHGGPQAVERKLYSASFQYFASVGYNVFLPNFRGSVLYGATFHQLVECDWGGGPRKDILEGVKWLIEHQRAEKGKVFLYGGSYGGYMVLLLLGRDGEWFKAGVDLFGLTNLLTFVEHVPDYWKPRMKAWVGDPETQREKLIEDSPITYIDQLDKPLMIYHGANDARVGLSESEQIVEAMTSRGIDVNYVVYDDAGHGFSQEQYTNIDRDVLRFFEQYL